jgi:hypothetical protein
MRRHWIHQTPSGRQLEYRLPWWLPLFLRLSAYLGVLRGTTPSDADIERLMQSHARVRQLPDGPWRRWRDLDRG